MLRAEEPEPQDPLKFYDPLILSENITITVDFMATVAVMNRVEGKVVAVRAKEVRSCLNQVRDALKGKLQE
jgi:hypothetical protein